MLAFMHANDTKYISKTKTKQQIRKFLVIWLTVLRQTYRLHIRYLFHGRLQTTKHKTLSQSVIQITVAHNQLILTASMTITMLLVVTAGRSRLLSVLGIGQSDDRIQSGD